MANIAVMTDSVSCIPQDLAKQYQISVVPAANILVDGKSFIDGETISATEAYKLIKEDPDRFVTSAVLPDYLLHKYEELAGKYREILFITIASSLSAVSRTATLAADLLKGKNPDITVQIQDSRSCASTQGLVVLAAAKAALQGKSLEETAALAEKVREQAGGIMMLDTLRYVYRTGRMSKTASRIVSLFNIKPINKITDNGTLEMIDRTRKTPDGIERLINAVARESGSDSLHFMVTHAAAAENAQYLVEQLKQRFNCLSMVVSDYSPVMGYGAGPGALFVGYHPEIEGMKD
jgi:DegV family protein with EDD domain